MTKKLIIGWCVIFVFYMALWWLQYDNRGIIHTNEKGIHRSIMIAQLKVCGLYKKLDTFYQQFPIAPVVPINWEVIHYTDDTMFTRLGDTSYIDTEWSNITSDTIPVWVYDSLPTSMGDTVGVVTIRGGVMIWKGNIVVQ